MTARAFLALVAIVPCALGWLQKKVITEPASQPSRPKDAKQAPWPKLDQRPVDLGWTSEEWTADEGPYLAVRKEVEEYVRGRAPTNVKTDLFERARLMLAAARANPKDPVKLYRGAYYAYELLSLEQRPEAKNLVVGKDGSFALNLGSVPPPRSREYDRLRLLIRGGYSIPFLRLAERLYAHDPTDVAVGVKLVWISGYTVGADRLRAVAVAERLLKEGDPKHHAAIYYAYGLAYHCALDEEYTAKNLERARWGYQRYLESGPSWRSRVREVNALVAGLERYVAAHPLSK